MTRVSAMALVVLVSLALLGPSSAAGEAPAPRRLLVLSIPTLAWDDLHAGDTPRLDALLDGAAVASLSVRDVGRTTDAADGYATVSAGTRARGVPASGQVLEPDEDYFGVPAGSVFRRNTGDEPGPGMVALAHPAVVSRNDRLDYDAEVGSLGEALADAGVPRAVIANADGRYPLGAATFDRAAGTSLVDEDGNVPAGSVAGDLVEEEPVAPFGVAYDESAVVAAFDEVWPAGGVVLVEGSDLERADRYRPLATREQQRRLREDALRRTDTLVGTLLERVDPDGTASSSVAPYHSRARVHLTVAGLRAPDVDPGCSGLPPPAAPAS